MKGQLSEAQSMVAEFHLKFGVPVESEPGFRRGELRMALIAEEALETCEAIAAGDLVETADGLCDLIYVCLGAACEFGIDLSPLFAEVHRTNMLKEGGGTRADGKIGKPSGWRPPRISELLDAQRKASK